MKAVDYESDIWPAYSIHDLGSQTAYIFTLAQQFTVSALVSKGYALDRIDAVRTDRVLIEQGFQLGGVMGFEKGSEFRRPDLQMIESCGACRVYIGWEVGFHGCRAVECQFHSLVPFKVSRSQISLQIAFPSPTKKAAFPMSSRNHTG